MFHTQILKKKLTTNVPSAGCIMMHQRSGRNRALHGDEATGYATGVGNTRPGKRLHNELER